IVNNSAHFVVASAKEEDNTSDSQKDPTKMPYVRPNKGLPKLKLILDPRHLVDMKRLLKEGVDIVEHNAVSPEICHDIVKDLNSPKGKGGQLFAKRKKKSEEWVVDEEKVRTLLHTRYPGYSSPEPPVEPLVHPRVKELSGVNSQDIAESVIRAAEAKIMTYPNAVPQVPVIECLDRPDSSAGSQLQTPLLANQYQKPNPWSSDAYKCRLPKGWTSSTTSSSILVQDDTFAVKESQITTFMPTAQPLMKSATTSKLFNFTNFNASPKAWSPELPQHFRPSSIKPVRPPSVLVQ
ncbi:uncharacterized protein LOC118191730, partial [Stegodyphus dumicola]|uniref:uncharacterized protein LOC118191730 n=1 Tax=Stegodyphus dumicola TaxID=202533 RepID=UPI0015AD28C7